MSLFGSFGVLEAMLVKLAGHFGEMVPTYRDKKATIPSWDAGFSKMLLCRSLSLIGDAEEVVLPILNREA